MRKLTLHNKLRTLGPLFSPILEANLKLREEGIEHFYNVLIPEHLVLQKVEINLFPLVVAFASFSASNKCAGMGSSSTETQHTFSLLCL